MPPATHTLEQSIQKTESLYVRLGLKIFFAILVLVALIWGGRVAFTRLQQHRLMGQAHASFAKGDKRWATIAARRVFELNPSNVDATRLLAEVAESEGSPATIDWRQQVLNAQPESVDDLLALTKSALRFGRLELAEQTLKKLELKANQLPAYHELCAQLAVSKKDPVAAQSHYAEAVRLDPGNKRYQLNLAVFQLQSSSADGRSQASTLLQKLMEDEKLRVPAARALRDYALQRRDTSALLEIIALLHSYPEAELRDRILYVQVLHQLNHLDFTPKLTELQEEASRDPLKLADVLRWMASEQLTLLALDWVSRLPVESVMQPPVPQAVADCYVALRDWSGLFEWSKEKDWGTMDFIRHAYIARSWRERGDSLEFRSAWGAALKAAGSNGPRISALQQETAKWGWKEESSELLWMLTKDPQLQDAALGSLYEIYSRAGQTADLFRVVARLLELRPDDLKTMNNFAQICLLLNIETNRAHGMAEQLYQRDPADPIYVSTYAYSLYSKGKVPQALEIMQKLKEEQLRQPPIAAYYGVMLAAANEKERAQEFLELGAKADLLPEEKALLAKANSSR